MLGVTSWELWQPQEQGQSSVAQPRQDKVTQRDSQTRAALRAFSLGLGRMRAHPALVSFQTLPSRGQGLCGHLGARGCFGLCGYEGAGERVLGGV